MQKTILRLVWPYVLRYLAKHGATYLESRRERKRLLKLAEMEPATDPVSPDAVVSECPPPPPVSKPVRPIWYVLAGVLLGSAIGLMLAKLLRE